MNTIKSLTINDKTFEPKNAVKLIDKGLGNYTTKGTYTADLSSYLDAGKKYLVTFEGLLTSSNTTGCYVRFKNSVFGDVIVAQTPNVQVMNDISLIIGSDKKIYYKGHPSQWNNDAETYLGIMPISYKKVRSITEGF